MWKLVTEAWRYRSVSENYISINLGLRYRRNVLGYLWSVLLPMFRYGAMGLVFSYVLNNHDPKYFSHFFFGMVAFSFLSGCIAVGTRTLVTNANYIKKIYVPKLLFTVNPILYETVNTALVLAAILVLGLIGGFYTPSWTQLLIVPGFLILMVFLIGTSCLLGVAMVWFNDVEYLVDIVMQTLMFVTPIMFFPRNLPEYLYTWNPFYYLVEIIRMPLAQGEVPSLAFYGIAVGAATISLLLGLAVLARKQDEVIYRL